VLLHPPGSVIVNVTENVPRLEYVWEGFLTVDGALPSPKSQSQVDAAGLKSEN